MKPQGTNKYLIIYFCVFYNLLTTNARNPINVSKDGDFRLDFFLKEAQNSL